MGRKHPTELTEIERQTLELACNGLSNQEIADKLFISIRTVENHIRSIRYKLDVHSQRQMLFKGYQMGFMAHTYRLHELLQELKIILSDIHEPDDLDRKEKL